jgi:hypothetical protein
MNCSAIFRVASFARRGELETGVARPLLCRVPEPIGENRRGRPGRVVASASQASKRVHEHERGDSVRMRPGGEHGHWAPPSDPMSAAFCDPAESRTATRSSVDCSKNARSACDTGSDRPVPRRSKMISRQNDASRSTNRAAGAKSQMASTLLNQAGMSTASSGPAPVTW